VHEVVTMTERLRESPGCGAVFWATVMSVVAPGAAVGGIYGVISHGGPTDFLIRIRVALGAQRTDILRLVLRHGLAWRRRASALAWRRRWRRRPWHPPVRVSPFDLGHFC
jgi:hypothetical protein